MLTNKRWAGLLVAAGLWGVDGHWSSMSMAVAQQAIALEGTEPWRAPLAEITEARVVSTLSFLASDALAGRGTGSKEFQIAAAYVASRFQASGLQGGGAEGSFFHEKILQLEQLPSRGTRVAVEANGIEVWGLLSAGAAAKEWRARATSVNLEQLPEESLASPIVWAEHQSAANSRRGPVGDLIEKVLKLKAKGAEVVLLAVDADDPLLASAAQAAARLQLPNPRTSLALPVVLVNRKDWAKLKAKELTVSVPAILTEEYRAQNVIGIIPGSDPDLAAEVLIFSAHLDHLGVGSGTGDQIFNGADDDASGVTAVLTLADAFAKLPARPARSVMFVTFWGEESGLLGSKEFVANPPWPLEKIVANVNIEMIGRPEPGANGKLWVTGWERSDLGPLMNQASQAVNVEIFQHPKFSAMLYQASDNWPLAQKGVIAHSFSGGSLHEDYHQPSDEWHKLNTLHMTQVIQGLFVGSLPIATGQATPQKK